MLLPWSMINSQINFNNCWTILKQTRRLLPKLLNIKHLIKSMKCSCDPVQPVWNRKLPVSKNSTEKETALFVFALFKRQDASTKWPLVSKTPPHSFCHSLKRSCFDWTKPELFFSEYVEWRLPGTVPVWKQETTRPGTATCWLRQFGLKRTNQAVYNNCMASSWNHCCVFVLFCDPSSCK